MTMNDCKDCIHFREKLGIEGADIADDYCLLHGYPLEQIGRCTEFENDDKAERIRRETFGGSALGRSMLNR